MRVSFVYVTDRKAFLLAQYAAMSAAISQPPGRDFHLFCHKFVPGAEGKAFAAAIAATGSRLHLQPIEDAALESIPTFGHLTSAAFLRMAAVGEATKAADRVVYLDTDTLVFEDLEIERIDMQGRSVAAVLDMDLSSTGAFRDDIRQGFRDPSMRSRFFNSGMMVFDAHRWRQEEFLRRFAEALAEQAHGCRYKLDCPPNDQCASNTLFEHDWTPLPLSYNFQAGGKFTAGWNTAKVRHYCGAAKFLPVTLRRNDARDIGVIGDISRRLGRPVPKLVSLYAIAFRLNALRHWAYARQMRRFIRSAEPRPS